MKVCGPTKQQVTLDAWFGYIKIGDVAAVQAHQAEFATQLNQQTGLSGLISAFLNRNQDIFDLLLASEISVRSVRKYTLASPLLGGEKLVIPLGSTIFHFVVAFGADQYFYQLLRHIQQNQLAYLVQLTNKDEETFLFQAAKLGYLPPFLDGLVMQNSVQMCNVRNVSVVAQAALYGRLRILLQFEKICSGDVLNMQRTQYINLDQLRREVRQMCFQALDSDEFLAQMEAPGEFEKFCYRQEDRHACLNVLKQICGYV